MRPPADVLEAVAAYLVGEAVATEPLGGLSGTPVLRVDGAHGSAVVKRAGPRERAVYVELAGVLADHGIRLPHLLATTDDWLVLEHLARPWPQERWGPDRAVLDVLHRLHALPVDVLDQVPDPFRPAWDDAVDDAGKAALRLPRAASGDLDRIRAASTELFEPSTVVSADPNPLNWRLDEDNCPVLLDWERIGLGHPAIDVAIVLPGLPSPEEARRAAAAYGHGLTARQVLVAKAWTVVELAAEVGPGPTRVIDQLRPLLPAWLGEIAEEV